MPICSYPGGCTEYAVKGDVRCAAHLIRNAADKKAESAALRKLKLTQAAAEARQAEQQRRNQVAQAKAEADRKRKAFQAEVIRTHRQTWNAQIDAVVAEVMTLRQADPNANAGNNTVGNTAGGTGSPLALAMTGPTHGVTRADILSGMAGFDSSDSGMFKFRRQGVLVHCT